MMYRFRLTVTLLIALTTRSSSSVAAASPIINEIADKGSPTACDGSDWIELYLPSSVSDPIDLAGYILHDDKGRTDDDAYIFPASTIINPGEYLLLCNGGDDPARSPQFGIGGDDEVTLIDQTGKMISTTGPLQDRGEFGVSYAYDVESDTFVYTTTPTPGEENTITLLPEPETVDEMRARLTAQNDEGAKFFNMNHEGKPVDGGFGDIVDLRMAMEPDLWDQMYQDRSYEVYIPFESAVVTTNGEPSDVLLNLTSPGRIRPKGQSTLAFGICLDRTIPYSIDFDRTDPDQTLFGVQRAYLRTHLGDWSFVREWSQHRMLARFNLPYLRTRTVRFFVNNEFVGLYDLVEAPDQDYVFQRSFPTFNPENYALYKVKTLSLGCGQYDAGVIKRAEERVEETVTPPYAFERGEHRDKIPVLKDWMACIGAFGENLGKEYDDVVLAYLRGNKDCSEVLVDEGLIDRDLGVKDLDDTMKEFIDRHLGSSTCTDTKCSNSGLANDANVDNFLRNFAVHASLLNSDSPLGNGNNYYLAYTGVEGTGWSMVQYDHNNILSGSSADLCNAEQCYEDLMKWSILRPTCKGLESSQMAGPLLTQSSLRQKYLEFVKEFVEDIMTNADLLDQIRNHMMAIKEEALKNDWNDLGFVYESVELSQSDEWLHDIYGTKVIAFLPALRVRSAEIQRQLEAIEAGSFPRAPDDINEDEVCVNWEATEARETTTDICPENCMYEGCYGLEFDVSAFCSPDDGKCYQGVKDSQCAGVPATQRYSGMTNFEGSDKYTFCWQDETLGPLKLAECPTYEGSDDSSGAAQFQRSVTNAVLILLLLAAF